MPESHYPRRNPARNYIMSVDEEADAEAIVYEEMDSAPIAAGRVRFNVPLKTSPVKQTKTPATDWVPPPPRKGWRRYRQ
jgi:hypothetical protein